MSGQFKVFDEPEKGDVIRLILVDEGDGVVQLQAVDIDGDIFECGCIATLEYGEPIRLTPRVSDDIGLPLTKDGYVRVVKG